MSLERLNIEGLRNLAPADILPGEGLNWFQGENGAGKTSILESLFLLARGRSFRSHRISSVIQHGADRLRVVARLRADGKVLGMERSPATWRGRIGGVESQRLSEFAACLPLVLMEPDSHRLIDGGPEHRRQYLDWQLFHVEHEYLPTWQGYARILRQRNAALKSGARDALLSALEQPMALEGDRVSRFRRQRVEDLSGTITRLASQLGVHLPGPIDLRYRSGFPEDVGLAEALASGRERDRELGFTRQGPHRGELVLTCAGRPAAQELSRGQQKLLALLLLLSQLEDMRERGSSVPILLLDDPVSELDDRHLALVLDWVLERPIQVWVTATVRCPRPGRVFHVERGEIVSVV